MISISFCISSAAIIAYKNKHWYRNNSRIHLDWTWRYETFCISFLFLFHFQLYKNRYCMQWRKRPVFRFHCSIFCSGIFCSSMRLSWLWTIFIGFHQTFFNITWHTRMPINQTLLRNYNMPNIPNQIIAKPIRNLIELLQSITIQKF